MAKKSVNWKNISSNAPSFAHGKDPERRFGVRLSFCLKGGRETLVLRLPWSQRLQTVECITI